MPNTRTKGLAAFVVHLGLWTALATTVRAEPVCGDVNDSDTVTSADALFVLRSAVGQPVSLVCPDFLASYGFDTDRGFTSLWSANYLFGVRVSVVSCMAPSAGGRGGRASSPRGSARGASRTARRGSLRTPSPSWARRCSRGGAAAGGAGGARDAGVSRRDSLSRLRERAGVRVPGKRPSSKSPSRPAAPTRSACTWPAPATRSRATTSTAPSN